MPTLDLRMAGMSGIHTRLYWKGIRLNGIQAVSWTTQRETGTIYEMGDVQPKAIASGKEGYGGSIVLAKYHGRDLLENFTKNVTIALWGDEYDLHTLQDPNGTDSLSIKAKERIATAGMYTDETQNDYETYVDGDYAGNKSVVAKTPWSLHQLPPLDLILVNKNESGFLSRMYILGIKFVNSGSSSSIDDIVMSESLTYICLGVTPWHSVRKGDDPWSVVNNVLTE